MAQKIEMAKSRSKAIKTRMCVRELPAKWKPLRRMARTRRATTKPLFECIE